MSKFIKLLDNLSNNTNWLEKYIIINNISGDAPTVYKNKLSDIFGIATSFCGFVEVFVGEHRIDFHDLSYSGIYLCEYGKIKATQEHFNISNSINIQILAEDGNSQPTISITAIRNTVLKILVRMYRSN